LFTHSRNASRKVPVALLAIVAIVLGVLAGLDGLARADTTASPDTNTRAILAPTTTKAACSPTPPTVAVAPCATATNGAVPRSAPSSTVLAGAVGGDFISIHVDGQSGTVFGVTRTALCRGSLTDVSLSAQILPSNGDCIPGGGLPNGEPGNGNHSAGGSNPPNTSLDYTFALGSGTYTPMTGAPISCDANNPCNLWIQESVSNASDGSGNAFKHFLVTYAGAPGAPGVVATPGNGALTVAVTPPANRGNSVAPLSYSVAVTGPGGSTQAGTGTSYTFTGLTNGTAYTVSATGASTAADGQTFTGPAGTATATPTRVNTTITATPAIASVSPLNVYLLNLNGTLKDADGNPIAGERVVFKAGSTVICQALTAVNGTASCSGLISVVNIVLSSGYTANFTGAGVYAPSSASAALITP
jgi:hypothetical protein